MLGMWSLGTDSNPDRFQTSVVCFRLSWGWNHAALETVRIAVWWLVIKIVNEHMSTAVVAVVTDGTFLVLTYLQSSGVFTTHIVTWLRLGDVKTKRPRYACLCRQVSTKQTMSALCRHGFCICTHTCFVTAHRLLITVCFFAVLVAGVAETSTFSSPRACFETTGWNLEIRYFTATLINH